MPSAASALHVTSVGSREERMAEGDNEWLKKMLTCVQSYACRYRLGSLDLHRHAALQGSIVHADRLTIQTVMACDDGAGFS
jgi:hypothetical protein